MKKLNYFSAAFLAFFLTFNTHAATLDNDGPDTPSESDDCTDTTNLIHNAYFVGFADSIGSSIDSIPQTAENTNIYVAYTIGKITDTLNWPWIQLNCYLPDETPWKELCGLKITYKSDHELDVKLDQPVLLNYGESYQKKLAPATQWTTVVISLKDFKQPEWSTHKSIPLDLKNIIGLGFAPDADTRKTIKKGTFRIKELTAFGLNINKKDTTNAEIIFYSITDNRVFLSVKSEGKYSIDIFNSNGEPVTSVKDVKMEKGYNDVKLKESIANGIYHIKIYNDKTSIKKLGVVGSIPAYYRR